MTDSPALQALLHNWFYGNLYVRELAAVAFAFLFGSIPITPAFHWLFDDLDDRIARTANALAPVVNAFKGFLPVAIATHGGGIDVGLMAAVAAVAGHCYCPWRRFDGGTGVALQLGVLSALFWPASVIYLAVWLVAATASNYALVGSLLASAVSVVALWFFLGASAALAGVAILVLAAGRQRAAFVRLSEDREPTLRTARAVAVRRAAAPARTASVIVMDGQAVQRV
jgi:acyl-phosphate glycerol 3-phosphate acyltransferase